MLSGVNNPIAIYIPIAFPSIETYTGIIIAYFSICIFESIIASLVLKKSSINLILIVFKINLVTTLLGGYYLWFDVTNVLIFFFTLVLSIMISTLIPISSGKGAIVNMAKAVVIHFHNVECDTIALTAGINIVGFSCFDSGFTAFNVLETLGSGNVSSIQKYDTATGLFITAAFNNSGELVGKDFPLEKGLPVG